MEIKFNLNEAEILLPSGRLMNLKDKLGWSDVSYDPKELEKNLAPVLTEQFHVDFRMEERSQKSVKEVMNNEQKKQARKSLYLEKGKSLVLSPEFFAQTTHNLTEEMREQIAQLTEEVLENERIKIKLEKLKKLQEINKTNAK